MTEQEHEDATDAEFFEVNDLLQGAEDCSAVQDLFALLEEDSARTILDEAQLRRQEDWSILAQQVVGGEIRT